MLINFASLNPSDPKARVLPTQDPDVAADAPHIDIEEMLQDLTINDDSRSHDHESSHNSITDSSGDVIMGTD